MLECGGVLTKKQVADITALSLEQLVRRLQTGALSAAHALEAYQRKALEVRTPQNHGKGETVTRVPFISRRQKKKHNSGVRGVTSV